MKTILAKTAGFCFGVKKAVETVYSEIDLNKKEASPNNIYTFGPIIHNDIVINDLKSKGVNIINSIDELEKIENATVIIRSHGVKRSVYDAIKRNNLKLVDATCPFVKRIHEIVDECTSNGNKVIITGDVNHPEVQGIMGWCNIEPIVIGNIEEAKKIKLDKNIKYHLVSQTTFNFNNLKYIVEILTEKGYDIIVLNTICNATHERQVEAEQISKEVDLMLVIGSKESSNTKKLYDICKNNCQNTYFIQELVDLDLCNLQSGTCVGITAGASTPNNIIEEVHNNVRNEF